MYYIAAVVVNWWAGTQMLITGMFIKGHKCEPGKENVLRSHLLMTNRRGQAFIYFILLHFDVIISTFWLIYKKGLTV